MIDDDGVNSSAGAQGQPPLFEDAPSVVSLNQNKMVGFVVLQVRCLSDEQVTYNLSERITGFDLNPTTGELTLSANAVDIAVGNYSLALECAIPRGEPAVAILTVIRVEANEFPPEFTTEDPVQVSLPETSPNNSFVAQVAAEDADLGENGEITYAIATSGADRFFSIDAGTGRIVLASSLNYQDRQMHQFEVTASDLTLSDSLIVMVNVTMVDNRPPVFESPLYTARAPHENPSSRDIIMVSCSDVDTPNSQLRYGILTQPHTPFTLHPVTGQLSAPAYGLDCDTTFFSLSVTCFDNSAFNRSGLATVEIFIQTETNTDPYLCTPLRSINIRLDEEIPVGHVVLSTNISASNRYLVCDDDCGSYGNITYTIYPATDPDPVITQYFTLDLLTGELTLSRPLDFDVPDTPLTTDLVMSRQVLKRVFFNIRGCDQFPPTFSCPNIANAIFLYIFPINEFHPSFSGETFPENYVVSINESAAFNQLVLRATCIDRDMYQGALDSITFVNASESVRNTFHLNTETGEVRVNLGLDYDGNTTSYTFRLKCNDSAGLEDYTTVTINVGGVNDNDPQFVQSIYNFNVSRTTPVNSYIIGTVVAEDADVGVGSSLLYSAPPPNEYFDVLTNGSVVLLNSVQNVTFPGYRFDARVEDEPGFSTSRTDTALVVVTFTDGNMVRPMYVSGTRAIEINELLAVGEVVLNLTCVDPEAGLNGLVTYYIRAGNSDQAFAVDSRTGTISVQRTLTLPRGSAQIEYFLDVICEDHGVPVLSSNAIILVRVLRDDSRPPVITTDTSSSIFVDEDAALNSVVATIVATDLDTDQLHYSFQNESDPGAFLIDPQSGQILVARTLDREQVSEYTMTVVVTEQRITAGTERSDSTHLTILVRDVNDNYPICDIAFLSVTVSYTISPGSSILALSCSDLDIGGNGNLTYTLENTFGVLAVNEMGLIYLNGSLSSVTHNRLTTAVTVSDHGSPTPLSRVYDVNIHLSSSNDHVPAFDNLPQTVTLPESHTPHTVVFTVSATDNDRGVFGQLVYRIVSSTGGDTFEIIPNTGDIFLRRDLDFFEQSNYTLVISIEDSDHRNTSTLVISVSNSNEHSPTCEGNNSRWVLHESLLPSLLPLFQLNCSDSDRGADGVLTYTIESGNDGSWFAVSSEGQVRVEQTLDYEQETEYRLGIAVSDGGTPPRSTEIVLIVQVEPVNEFPPVLSMDEYSVALLENVTVGTVLVTVMAQDNDSSSHRDGQISFSLAGLAQPLFAISRDGAIQVSGELDRETQATYTFMVIARDGGVVQMSSSSAVTVTLVDIDDNSPTFTETLYVGMLNQQSTSEQTVILTVQCTDPDTAPFAAVEYSLDPTSPSARLFQVSSAGEVRARGPSTSRGLHTFRVRCTGPSPTNRFDLSTVSIDVVANENISFSSSIYTASVPENVEPVFDVLQVSASSPTSPNLRYRLTELYPLFSIDGNSGTLRLLGSVDFETNQSYVLQVEAYDVDNPSNTGEAVVRMDVLNVNDERPAITTQTELLNLTEGFTSSTLYNLECTDGDAGALGNTVFRIVGGNTPSIFSLTTSGTLRVNGEVDYEVVSAFQLEIACEDGGTPPLTDRRTIPINVIPVNDNPPTFSQETYTFEISEAVLTNSVVGEITATDQDRHPHNSILYSILTGNTEPPTFAVNPSTGQLTLTRSLDYEGLLRSYSLMVQVNDGGAQDVDFPILNDTATVSVIVTNANDNNPVLSSGIYTGSVPETVAGAQVLLAGPIACTDADFGDAISLSTPDPAFQIDTGGMVLTTQRLDYETQQLHQVEVRCTDSLDPPRSAVATLYVTVTDINEFSPRFTNESGYQFNILESTAVGSMVGRIEALDEDGGPAGVLSYSFVNNTGSPFALTSHSGSITLLTPLDFETQAHQYILQAIASDTTNDTNEVNVMFNIVDVDDNLPAFSRSTFFFSIRENSLVGSTVGHIQCTDADNTALGVPVEYSMETSPFRVGTQSGLVEVDSGIDLETIPRYTLRASCRDHGGNVIYANVTITLLPFNDYTPVFIQSNYTSAIVENLPSGSLVERVTAADDDLVDYFQVTYSIIGGNEAGLFTVDPAGGEVRIRDVIDREVVANYVLMVQAQNVIPPGDNSGSRPLSSVVSMLVTVLDLNDNSPTITPAEPAPVFISEAVGPVATVAHLTCSDPDDGLNGTTTLLIPNLEASERFRVLSNGTIVTTQILTSDEVLTVTCIDRGVPPRASSVEIPIFTTSVNNFPPEFASSSFVLTVPENFTIGNVVDCINATDQDGSHTPDGVVEYSLRYMSGDQDKFRIRSGDGCIILSQSLDYDLATAYRYELIAMDRGVPVLRGNASLSIQVTDFVRDPPEFQATLYTSSIPENIGTGFSVVQVRCTDLDFGDVISYSIISAVPQFTIDPATGVVTIASSLDYELSQSHVLEVSCQDPTLLIDQAEVVVTVLPVNEFAPYFISAAAQIEENSIPGTRVSSLQWTDSDTGSDGMVSFTINSGNVDDVFSISPSGQVFVRGAIDQERLSFYSLNITISDMSTTDPRSSTGLLNVSILDINDNRPQFPQAAYEFGPLLGNETSGYFVGTVRCMDADVGSNGQVSYQISSDSNDNVVFSINPMSGDISVTSNLSDRQSDIVTLIVLCVDMGRPEMQGTARVLVRVEENNAHAPQFLNSSYSIHVREDAEIIRSILVTVTATDDDDGINGRITYSLLNTFNSLFFINERSGELSLLRSLNYEEQLFYELTAIARDAASDSRVRLRASAPINVHVEGVNEFFPRCRSVIYNTIINSTSQGPIIDFMCADDDRGPDGELEYAIVSGNELGYFSIEAGRLVIQSPFMPTGGVERFRLVVVVRDTGLVSRNTTIEVILPYSFSNLARPVFEPPSYSISLSESTEVGTVVSSVSAIDSDTGIQGQVTYSVNGSDIFRVNPNSGDLYLASALDWERSSSSSFYVIATDNDPSFPLSSSALVSVTVINENDNPPNCDRTVYTSQLLSNAGIGDRVVALNCTDLDRTPLTYSLLSSSPSVFQVDSTLGQVLVAQSLDSLRGSNVVVDVEVSDGNNERVRVAVNIAVLFANQHAPVFQNSLYTFYIAESIPLLSTVGHVQATDSDSSVASLTYSQVAGGVGGVFYLDPVSGRLILTASLDFERAQEYPLTLVVSDGGSFDASNVLSSTVSVVVRVNNTNDNEPVFSNGGVYGSTVAELTRAGTSVVSLSCTDRDAPPFGTTQIVANIPETVPFELVVVEEGRAEVQVSGPLSGPNSFIINTTCSDGERETAGQVFLFVPEPLAPVFSMSSYEWLIRETAPTGSSFQSIQATSNFSALTYSIADGNSEGVFYIEPSTGSLSLVATLDYETQQRHGLIIRVVDTANRESNVLLLVQVLDVDDDVPLVPPSALFSVLQNSPPGYPVGVVQCVDDESSLNRSILNYTFGVTPSQQFSIDASGLVRLEARLDETPVYVLPLTCFDVRNPQHNSTGIVTIEVEFVNQYMPTFAFSTYQFIVAEDFPALVPLGPAVAASDRDIGSFGQVMYTIQSIQNQFFIDSLNGTVESLTSLDRETQDSYSFTIAAIDGGVTALNTTRMTGTATVFVRLLDVNDNSPVLDQLSYVQTIYTNHSVGSPVLSVDCSDPDLGTNGTVDFSLSPSDILDHFSIQSNGSILLNQQQPNQVVHTFSAVCTDRGAPPRSSSSLVTVIVNFIALGAPEFSSEQYNATIPENTTVTSSVLTVRATPSDASISVVYEIVGGNDGNSFFLNSETGELSVRNPLDARRQQNYALSVRAGNFGSDQLFSLSTISVFVEDINDNSPEFQLQLYTTRISENASPLTPVLIVQCTDSDVNSNIVYSLGGQSLFLSSFNITQSGLIYVTGGLDYEVAQTITLEVICRDGLSEPRSVTSFVRIDISPVNEFRPQFSQNRYTFQATENDFGALIGQVSASDADSGLDGSLSYLLQDPRNFSVIFVDSTDGSVYVSDNLDYESQSSWNFIVTARDHRGLESLAQLNVEVVNVNDEPPALFPPVAVTSVEFDRQAGFPIQSYVCRDPDAVPTSITIASGNAQGYFELDSNNILSWTGLGSDLVSDTVVSLTLQCLDLNDTSQTADSIIAISINVTNSPPPVFSEETYSVFVSENRTVDSVVHSVTAVALNGSVLYNIISTLEGFPFAVNATDGTITLTRTLDREAESFYSFFVSATDTVSLGISVALVEITIVDVNDNPPEITPSMQSITLSENYSSFSEPIFFFLCSDSDARSNSDISFQISSGDPLGIFSVNTNGQVFLNQPIDFETTSDYTLEIVCSDSLQSPLTDTATLFIQVTSYNEHSPVFSMSPYLLFTSEMSPVGSSIGTVMAGDADSGVDGVVSYSILSPTESFTIGDFSGEIFVSRSLDFDVQPQHRITVLARDSAQDPVLRMSATATIVIDIVAVNEHSPACVNVIYQAVINASSEGEVVDLVCSDQDGGQDGELRYSILSGNDDGYFAVVEGSLIVPAPFIPDDEAGEYRIQILVQDMGIPSRNVTIEAILFYSYENMVAPVFNQTMYMLEVDETTPVGTVVATLMATDSDPSIQGQVAYSIEGSDNFRIDSSNGNLFLASPLDWEMQRSLLFVVQAQDGDPFFPLSGSAVVNVSILNSNDNPPQCDRTIYTAQILSNVAIGQRIFLLNCSDLDENALRFSIPSSLSEFAIGSVLGDVYVNGPIVPDFTYVFDIQVLGEEGEHVNVSASITVLFANTQAPRFSQEVYNLSILESSPVLATIGRVRATDGDAVQSVLTYSVVAGESDRFYLHPSSGVLVLTLPLDFETAALHTLTIQVSDEGSFDGSNVLLGMATVNVLVENSNDADPVFRDGNIYGRTISALTPVGTTVLTLYCIDGDAPPYGDPVVTAEGIASIPFQLAGVSQGIAELVVSTPLSGEETYFVNVSCNDGDDQEVQALVYVFIPEPQAPNFTLSSYNWYINELANTGTSFAELQASSQDGSEISYSIVDGNADGIFSINQSSGALSLIRSLDYEEQSQHGLLVQAMDGQGRRSNVLLLVHVVNADDELPLIPPSRLFSVQQNEVPGFPVGAVQCVDADDRRNSTVFNYTFNTPSQQFSIDSVGLVRLQDTLDETPVYVIPVTCFDVGNPERNSTGIITIEVEFINQYPPIFQFPSYSLAVVEDFPALSPLGPPVVATDRDIGSFGQLAYAILGDQEQFFIDAILGSISSLTPLDRETQSSYTLTVAAVDGGITALNTTRMTGTATVFVRLLDVNDNSPVLDQLSYVQTIYTNHSVGSPVLSVDCSDPDLGTNGTVDFSLSPSNILDHFSIQSGGSILLNQQQPNQAVHTFSAVCTDRGAPPRSSSSLVTVIVNFIALGAPEFSSEQYNATIPENTTVTSSVLTVRATPSDASISVVYEIVRGNDGDSFFLNSETGELSVRNPLDARRQQNYVLTVRAGNEGSNQLFSLATISIFVEDVNDNFPSFESQFYTQMILENASLATPILALICTDSDLSSDISYTLSETSALSLFNITSEDGTLYVAGALDYEMVTAHSLEVVCSDGGPEPRTARASVRVEVVPVNEFRPMFLQPEYNFQATENDFGAMIGRVQATDGDRSVHGSITYLLLDPENASVVFVEPISGFVRVSNNLDYEAQPFWNLTVLAVDGGRLESSVPLNIQVINVNDALPVLDPPTAVHSVDVDQASNTPLQAYTCVDPDGSDTTVSITSGNSAGFFRFEGGVVLWAGNSQNATRNLVVSLTIHCFDNLDPNQVDESILAVSIVVTDAPPPVFSESPYTRSILENTTANTTVVTVSASGENSGLVYSFVNIPFGFPFSIDSSSGNITLSGSLDSDVEDSFSFVVLATDPISESVGLVFVEISVLDINDNPPVITPSSVTVRLPESFQTGVSFTNFLCTDDDTGDHTAINFGFESGNDQRRFSIDSSGFVYLLQPLDFEHTSNFSLVVLCSDSTENPLHDTAILNVIVEGVNEHQPIFGISSYYFAVSEYTGAGDSVGTVTATDLDRGPDGLITYSVLSGSGMNFFGITSTTGEIRSSILPLNATRDPLVQLNLRASDEGGLHGDAIALIRVQDVNEPPQFSNMGNYFVPTSTSIPPGSTIFSFTCYDLDTGNNSDVDIQLTSIPPLLDLYLFTASRTSAQDAHLRTNATLPAGSFELSVTCSDGGSPPISSSTSITLRVESLNMPPAFTSTIMPPAIAENIRINSEIFSVTAMDAETGVVYSISGGTGLGTFQVGRESGVVTVVLPLDYEIVPLYTLNITATDLSPSNPQSTTMTISITVTNVNDELPILSLVDGATLTLRESSSPSTRVATYTCSDRDGTPVSLSISSSENPFPFSITPSGSISLTGHLDYEVRTLHTITVTCTDQEVRQGEGTVHQTSSTLRVSIQPENLRAPEFTSGLTFNVSENTDIGSIIATVQAVDRDNRGPVIFDTEDPGFLVSRNGSIQLLMTLDYENVRQHTLAVTASDNDNVLNLVMPRTTPAIVTIVVEDYNDNIPECDSNALFVSFNTGDYGFSGISLVQLNCSDRDSGDNALLRYSFNEDTLPFLTDGNFHIDNGTGEMQFVGSIAASGTVIVQIRVEDSGTPLLLTTVDVAVQIIDTNATRPQFNISLFSVEISEEHLSPSIILSGSTIREQFINPDNYTVLYDLRPSPLYNGIFIMNSVTADLILADNDLLDYDRGSRRYLLTLQAKVNQQVENALIRVSIEDFNDNVPRFTRTLYTPTVLENQPPGTYVLDIEATDADSEENGMLSFSILNGNFPFSIDPQNGTVTTEISFDREIADRYTVFVLAADAGHPSLTGTATVNILIGDQNDRPPFFLEDVYVVNVNNTVRPGERILTTSADDEDSVGTLTFQINDEEAREVFLIDSNGTVRVRSAGLPPDHPPRYNFTVEVSDGVQSDYADVIIYTVFVTSDTILFAENDLEQEYDAYLFLSKTFNLSSEATYTIFRGDPSEKFEITSSGILMPVLPLDRENISQYELGIRVVDVDNIDLEITVLVLDKNDNAPEFDSDFYHFNVSEGHYHNEAVFGFINATDEDEPGRGASTIEYSIITPVEGIAVRAHTGELYVVDGAVLDRERMLNFTFAVQARDFGEPESLSTLASVTVTLEDINDNDPEFVPLVVQEYMVLLQDDNVEPNTPIHKIRLILPNGFETDVESITVTDPDIVGTVTATIEHEDGTKPKFAFRDPNAENLEIITTAFIEKEDLGMTLQVVLRDQPEDEEDNPVIRNITFVGPDTIGFPTTMGLSTTESVGFFQTEAGIAVLVVICLLIVLVVFAIFCLICCLSIRREKDPLEEG